MSRIVPILIAVVAIAALTLVEGRLSDRWGDSRLGSYCVSLMDDVPTQIGPWVATDNEVSEMERDVSGAKGYVSRSYVNAAAGKQVGVWFIVGHARDVSRHTPDICYGGNGFKMEDEQASHALTLEDGSTASFWTAIFDRSEGIGGGLKQRVFWTWFRPSSGSRQPVEWSVPDTKSDLAVRQKFRATPALFKLYFTTNGPAAEVEPDDNVCMEFAEAFFAEVNPILEAANGPIPDSFSTASVGEGA